MAHPAFGRLRAWAAARFLEMPDGPQRRALLAARLAEIPPEAVQPPPLVNGDDLLSRGVEPGPIYKRVLDELYTRQLNETLTKREAALELLDKLLAEAAD